MCRILLSLKVIHVAGHDHVQTGIVVLVDQRHAVAKVVKHHFYRVVCLIRQGLADDNVNGGGADKGLYGVVVVEADQLNVLISPHPHQTPGNGLGNIAEILDAAAIRLHFHQTGKPNLI